MAVDLRFSPEVAAARANGTPVVALESTIITHGMPHPQNIETAQTVEADIRRLGATPATIAVLDGALHIGLEPGELARLAGAREVAKLSRADIAACLATGGTGATTVAATMIAARLAGIEVFATGGIGGVHKGAEASFDISADLHELAQTAVTVVAAGPKAILDLPKTLEVLETLGVPVIAVGQDEVPAFWSRASGLAAPLRIDAPAEIARAHILRGALGLAGGQLVTNPIPKSAEIRAPTWTRSSPLPRLMPKPRASRQGGDAFHARSDSGADRRKIPGRQYRLGAQQCSDWRPEIALEIRAQRVNLL